MGYKRGLFEPYFEQLNASHPFIDTPYWGIRKIRKESQILGDTHVYSVILSRPEVDEELEDVLDVA